MRRPNNLHDRKTLFVRQHRESAQAQRTDIIKVVSDSETLKERKPSQPSFKLYRLETRQEGWNSVTSGGGICRANFYKYLTAAKSERNITCGFGMMMCKISCFGKDLTGSERNFKQIDLNDLSCNAGQIFSLNYSVFQLLEEIIQCYVSSDSP